MTRAWNSGYVPSTKEHERMCEFTYKLDLPEKERDLANIELLQHHIMMDNNMDPEDTQRAVNTIRHLRDRHGL